MHCGLGGLGCDDGIDVCSFRCIPREIEMITCINDLNFKDSSNCEVKHLTKITQHPCSTPARDLSCMLFLAFPDCLPSLFNKMQNTDNRKKKCFSVIDSSKDFCPFNSQTFLHSRFGKANSNLKLFQAHLCPIRILYFQLYMPRMTRSQSASCVSAFPPLLTRLV